MNRYLIILLCFTILFSMSACQKIDLEIESAISSNIFQNESIINESRFNTSISNTESNKTSSIESTTINNSDISNTTVNSDSEEGLNSTVTSNDQDGSYTDIICTKVVNFRQIGFSVKSSSTMLFITIPKEWKLEKSTNGYRISKNSQTIGTVTVSTNTSSSDGSVNVFCNEFTANDVKVTHSINRISSDNTPSYIRILCYSYDDAKGNRNSITLTFPYQEIDSSAAYKMITETKTATASTETNFGVLQINDNRNKILILGNSFIGSSSIGSILQTMCGAEVSVEAHSRGYAHVGTYTNDATMMQNIRNGYYSVVFMCGLYDQEAVNDLADMIKVCKDSNTKLAVFPAHNESQPKIEHAISLYPDTIFLNWKAEIDSLISTGIDVSNFCIPDAHKHSTPLAGYVGAHMIYRAIFNKIPQTTQFTEVSQSQIDLLGEYTSTGSIVLIDNNDTYVIE